MTLGNPPLVVYSHCCGPRKAGGSGHFSYEGKLALLLANIIAAQECNPHAEIAVVAVGSADHKLSVPENHIRRGIKRRVLWLDASPDYQHHQTGATMIVQAAVKYAVEHNFPVLIHVGDDCWNGVVNWVNHFVDRMYQKRDLVHVDAYCAGRWGETGKEVSTQIFACTPGGLLKFANDPEPYTGDVLEHRIWKYLHNEDVEWIELPDQGGCLGFNHIGHLYGDGCPAFDQM